MKKILVISLASVLALTGIVTTSSIDNSNYTIVNNSFSIKRLNSVENEDGSVSQIFSYSYIGEMTDKSLSLELSFADGSSCDDYVNVSCDQNNQLVTVTCTKAFSQQIILKVTPGLHPELSKSVAIDYTKKLLSIEPSGKTFIYGDLDKDYSFDYSGDTYLTDYIINPTYSDYSVDVDYSYDITFSDVHFVYESYNFEYEVPADIYEIFDKEMPSLITKYLNGDSTFKWYDLWNLEVVTGAVHADFTNWQTWLLHAYDVISTDTYLAYQFHYEVTENLSGLTYSGDSEVYLSLDHDWSQYENVAEAFNLEEEAILF